MTVRSTNNQFILKISVDGEEIMNKSYSWFESVSDVVKNIAAFQDNDGRYVLHVSDIYFTSNLEIALMPIQYFTVDEVYCRINLWR
jgi:hypothetical protein